MLNRWIHVQKIQYGGPVLHQILLHPLKVTTRQGGYRLKVKSKHPNSKVTVRRGKSLVSGAGKFSHEAWCFILYGRSLGFESDSQETQMHAKLGCRTDKRDRDCSPFKPFKSQHQL